MPVRLGDRKAGAGMQRPLLAIAAILFFATEDGSLPAAPIDEWALPMFILFLAAAAPAAISLRFDEDLDEESTGRS